MIMNFIYLLPFKKKKKSVQSVVHAKTELKQVTTAAITTTREFDIQRIKQ